MPSRASLLGLVLLAGCAPAPRRPRTVRLPQGLARPGTAQADRPDATAAAREGIVVEGVCRGEGAGCWGLDGAALPNLAQGLASVRARAGGRLLVVTLPVEDARRTVRLLAFAGRPARDLYADGDGATRRHAYAVDAGPSGREGAATFVVETHRSETIVLPLRVGATAAGLRVASIAPLRGAPFVGWRVEVRAARREKFVPAEIPPLVMADGTRYALREGRIVTTDAYRLLRLGEAPGGFALALDRDPARVGSVRLRIQDERRITVVGIPLNPR